MRTRFLRLRSRTCALFALGALALTCAGPASAHELDLVRPLVRGDRLEAQILAEINEVRRAAGLGALTRSPRLAVAADAHSRSMALEGYFSHRSSDGTPFWRRIERFYPSRGFERWSVGENLLWRSPDVAAGQAVGMWLASPSHRRILLGRGWRRIGIGAAHAGFAPGIFRGLPVTIVTADFGSRE